MKLEPEVEYLLRIFPIYKSMGSENYIISKLLYLDNKFISCRRCKIVYIPVVNCTTRYDNNKFHIICKKCKTVSFFEEDIVIDVDLIEYENLIIDDDESSF